MIWNSGGGAIITQIEATKGKYDYANKTVRSLKNTYSIFLFKIT